MKTALIWVVVALPIGALLFGKYRESLANQEAIRERNAEIQRVERQTRNSVAELVSFYGAVDDWDQRLDDRDTSGLGRILTIDLENLWQAGRPILFVGCITDVASAGQDTYRITLERDCFGKHIFSTELRLSLVAPKGEIDSFLKAHPQAISYREGVAIIAQIARITVGEGTRNGEPFEAKTGHGKLLKLVHTADAFLLQ